MKRAMSSPFSHKGWLLATFSR